MTISDNGNVIETIVLSDYDYYGQEAMHNLFREKGFQQLSDEELKEKLEARDQKEKEEEMNRTKIMDERRAAMAAAAAEAKTIREEKEKEEQELELELEQEMQQKTSEL
mmetsp:Transcript_16847/g.31905  ORF Transcript_16847/g.31905 Transcript_16847/m.31905 type:complete len:109 (-) Transcript_16847:254-580(-)|eukprot:CAMPEP_0176492572 /NCGR_PEP_ID=MMETSP0200_2-20121128/9078_1 /TAXON_ID=947934 /ORGANISM="Chaetoceros sp., Strain GSL56" /LENGTH=108 /DNA_ID=CAMNT_0017890159 /DNA_START=259 /DNA_END=585 /DNA_ORIENTATION=+